MVEDGGGVVGVAEPPGSDEPRQERIEVVVVGFGSAEFGCERAECVGLDGAVGLVGGEPGGAEEGGPAVVLGGCGDGFVFGGELRGRGSLVVSGGDGLVGGEFGSGAL